MPEEPEERQEASGPDDDLDKELAEFERELQNSLRGMPEEERGKQSTPPEIDLAGGFPTAEEIEARLSRAIGFGNEYRETAGSGDDEPEEVIEAPDLPNAGGRFDEVDAEFDERLRRMNRSVTRAGQARKNEANKKERERAQERESARGLGIGLTVAYTIIGFPLLGAGVGFLIDRSTGGTAGVTLGTVLGVGLGMAAAIFMLNRASPP